MLTGCPDGSGYPADGFVQKVLRQSSSEQPEELLNRITNAHSPAPSNSP